MGTRHGGEQGLEDSVPKVDGDEPADGCGGGEGEQRAQQVHPPEYQVGMSPFHSHIICTRHKIYRYRTYLKHTERYKYSTSG